MAGQLTIDTLRAGSGVLATQNGMTGIAKAWVNFNGNSSPYNVIAKSFNVSSITYISAGLYTINFTTAMPDANYSATGMMRPSGAPGTYSPTVLSISYSTAPTTSALTVETRYGDSSLYNFGVAICVAVFD